MSERAHIPWWVVLGCLSTAVIEDAAWHIYLWRFGPADAWDAWVTALVAPLLASVAIICLRPYLYAAFAYPLARQASSMVIVAVLSDVAATALLSDGYADEGNQHYLMLMSAGVGKLSAILWLQGMTLITTIAMLAGVGAWAHWTCSAQRLDRWQQAVLIAALLKAMVDSGFHFAETFRWIAGDRGGIANLLTDLAGFPIFTHEWIPVVAWMVGLSAMAVLWKQAPYRQGNSGEPAVHGQGFGSPNVKGGK